jgi:hypothetical protein
MFVPPKLVQCRFDRAWNSRHATCVTSGPSWDEARAHDGEASQDHGLEGRGRIAGVRWAMLPTDPLDLRPAGASLGTAPRFLTAHAETHNRAFDLLHLNRT